MSQRVSQSGWWGGVLATLPIVPGVVSVGMLYGVTAVEAGMPPWTVLGMSVLVATGTAQLVALELLGQGVAWWLIVLVGLVINLRFIAYSLHLGRVAGQLPQGRRLAYLGLLNDEGYALTVTRLDDEADNQERLLWSAAAMASVWLAWPVGTAVGAYVGGVVPSFPGMELMIPLALLNVLVLLLRSWRHLVVAVLAGAVTLLLAQAPFGLGLLGGILAGVGVGLSFRDSDAGEAAA